jgi:HAD superfamily hydrolase (TIGR01509 family)
VSLAAKRLSPAGVRYHALMPESGAVDWPLIDTVLLDMDGTLLDLSFDNHFWLDLVPRRYAELNGLAVSEAKAQLQSKFRAIEGTLDWYSIDYWSRELGFDVASIKLDARERVCFHPGAERFLDLLAALGKRRVLLTNAHPRVLAIKDEQVGLARHFDAVYSTHPFGLPKERPDFWGRFHDREPFDPARTLFADDSLQVLRAAHAFGVKWLRVILRPDSKQPARAAAEFASVDYLAELL